MEPTIQQTLGQTFGLISLICALIFIVTSLIQETIKSKGNWLKAKRIDNIVTTFGVIAISFFILLIISIYIP